MRIGGVAANEEELSEVSFCRRGLGLGCGIRVRSIGFSGIVDFGLSSPSHEHFMKLINAAMRACAFVILMAAFSMRPALADSQQCTAARDKGKEAVSSYYDPRIKQINDVIQAIKDKGGDPNAIAIKVGNKFYTSPEIAAKLERDKQIALTAVSTQIDDCEKGVKPYQDVVNNFANIATSGIAGQLPAKMAFIDASEILAGYPLGGPDALIPKAREQIMNAVGLGGNNDLGKIIKDPARPIKCIFGC